MMFILLFGMSGSGKTTISIELQNFFYQHKLKTTVLPLDYFYKVGPQESFDVPDAFDWKKLKQCLICLSKKQPYTLYPYVYEKNVYDKTVPITVYTSDIIIIEGIYANYARFLLLNDPIVIHVDTPPDICLARRCLRDKEERNIKPEENLKRWLYDVRPRWDQWQRRPIEAIQTTHFISGENGKSYERDVIYKAILDERFVMV